MFLGSFQVLHAEPFAIRSLWVVRNTLTSKEKIDDMVRVAARNDFNHILVQVRGRGDAYYKSHLVPRSELLNDPGFDPLAYTIRQAHARGLKVHAWVNAYILWSASRPPRQSTHIFNTNSEWLDHDGENQSAQLHNGSYTKEKGDEGFYLAPHHPEVNPYLLAVFREIVAQYDIDGLHLDYIRYKDSDYGQNDSGLDYFKETGGTDPNVLLQTYRRRQINRETLQKKMQDWDDFRRNSVTELVKSTHQMIQNIRPKCIFSVAVKPNLDEAHNRYMQAWDIWVAAGYVDWAIPMNYSRSIREFAKNIDLIYDRLPKKYRDKIIMGLAVYNQSSLDAADKAKYSRVTHFNGVSIFSYNTLHNNPRYFYPLRKVILDR